MAVIKIEDPILEYMDESMTEQDCDKLRSNIQYALESEHTINSALLEFAPELVAIGAGSVAIIIGMIRKWLKGKYSLSVKRIITQSKELNDLYAKVEDMLAHDKMARFKHRNDLIDAESHSVILIDTKNPIKKYNITTDQLAYDPEYFIDEINQIMEYINAHPATKDTDMENMKASLMKIIDDNFDANHWFTAQCEPNMKIEKYNKVKLESAVKFYKSVFSAVYNNVAVFNSTIGFQMKVMQLIEQGYNKMMRTYGDSKEGKALVEAVFKKLLTNITTSIDFNGKVMAMIEEQVRYYCSEMQRVYNIIRS